MTAYWIGASGARCRFDAYDEHAPLTAIGCVYIWNMSAAGNHGAVYVGETADLVERLKDHRKERCIQEHGATYIHVLEEANPIQRQEIERDLIEQHDPPCNG